MDCELLAGCLFFNDKMKDMPATSLIYKSQYCRTDKSSCARYMVYQALGRGQVPADLFPNDQDRARSIIAGK
jgi:hypothetical protein